MQRFPVVSVLAALLTAFLLSLLAACGGTSTDDPGCGQHRSHTNHLFSQ